MIREIKTIEITNHNAFMIHLALVQYSKKFNRDEDYDAEQYGELAEIDRILGYEGLF